MLISLTFAEGKTIAIRFIFGGCCARAASDHVAPVPSAVMKSRRPILPAREGVLRIVQTTATSNVQRGTNGICQFGRWPSLCPRWVNDRDRGEPRGSAPPTPPYVRVRIRRFEKLR